jgi:hypothetical protein
MTEYNSKAQLELIDKQAQLLQMMRTPVVMVTEKNLRDEFAMAALNGVLSNPVTQEITEKTIKTVWQVADFMMEARK